nr:protein SRG1 [Ipomoea batatas]
MMEIMEEEKPMTTGWGKSLAVPSVQEIVRKDVKDVPERYIQNEEDRPKASEISLLSSEIPIINLSLLENGDEDELRKLDFASKEWGFFQVIDHGVRDDVLRNMKAAVASFFELPVEDKKKYAMAENDLQGYGQGYVVSDQQKLDWNDLMFLVTLPPKYRNMKYWPSTLSGFKEAVEEYAIDIEMVTTKILANLSLLMGMEKHSLREMHGEMKQGIRMNYYPPCAKSDLVLGVSPHSDSSSITLLLQEDEIAGLQIRHKQSWVPINPIPNAIVVNLGDVMEAWSNGVYKSIEHRAVTNQTKARISVATFVIPEDQVDIEPVETMVDDRLLPRKYKSVKRRRLGWRENHQLAGENHWLYLVYRRLLERMQRMFLKDTFRMKRIGCYHLKSLDIQILSSKISLLSSEIPIINLSLLDNGDENELRKLDFASKEWGFFQVINHGVTKEVLQNMEAAAASFFELPVEEKEKYAMAENDIQGYGQTYIVSEQQKLDWNDSMFLVTLPPKHQDMKYWPSTLVGFKEAIEQYAKEIETVTTKILANLSQLMGMEKHNLRQMHGEMKQGIRLNYYSPCAEPDLVLGVRPHSDISSISLLLQEDEITGLQIRHKESWVPVNPIPNAIVVNIGDVMEGWSNGVYKSIEHRAVTNQTKARISIAAFVIPEDQVDIGPVETMVDDNLLSRKYKSVKYIDFIRYNLARKMDGKSHTDYLKL